MVPQHLLVHGAPSHRATLVLAHGAGSAMDAPLMVELAEGLGARGIEVVRFEFPYMDRRRREGKRGPPDKLPELCAAYRGVVAQLQDRARLFIGGRSMGGRVATHISDAPGVRGVVALGYPFHPPKKPLSLRVDHLAQMKVPCLIVQGTRDPFGGPDEVARYELPASISLCWLEDGDHSFEPRKKSGFTLSQHLVRTFDAVEQFIGS